MTATATAAATATETATATAAVTVTATATATELESETMRDYQAPRRDGEATGHSAVATRAATGGAAARGAGERCAFRQRSRAERAATPPEMAPPAARADGTDFALRPYDQDTMTRRHHGQDANQPSRPGLLAWARGSLLAATALVALSVGPVEAQRPLVSAPAARTGGRVAGSPASTTGSFLRRGALPQRRVDTSSAVRLRTQAEHGGDPGAGAIDTHDGTPEPGAEASELSISTATRQTGVAGARDRGPRGPPAARAALLSRATQVLGRTPTAAVADAIEDAHHVGDGELGRDGVRPAQVGNYTQRQLAARVRILRSAGLDRGQVRRLVAAGVVGDPPGAARNRAHDAITTDLYNGQVVRSRPFSAHNNRNALFLVSVRNPNTGRVVQAIFKARMWGDNDGWNRTPVEYVAYRINRLLDMDYVPPVAYRRNIDVEFQTRPEGALLEFIDDARPIYEVPAGDWGVRQDLLLSDTRVLDVLIQNSDRHRDNFLIGRHWATGRQMPVLLDHAAGFRAGASVTMTQDNAFGTGAVNVVRRSTLDALRRMDAPTLRREVGEFLSEHEIRQVLQRRDGIVSYFDNLIRDHGAANVVADVTDF